MADGMDWQERAREIDKARSFYYTRMSTTSNLLVAGAALAVAVVTLFAAVIPVLIKG